MQRVAIIGNGAAAYGVMHGLLQSAASLHITLIAPSRNPAGPFETDVPAPLWTASYKKNLYRFLRDTFGYTVFPPPKTAFGHAPVQKSVSGGAKLWDNHYDGGLTGFWGLSSIPFGAASLSLWPGGASALEPHYREIANDMGIAGQRGPDSGNESVDRFVNLPPAYAAPLVQTLIETLRGRSAEIVNGYRVTPLSSQLAMETRPERADACIGCGECMIGCPQKSMFTTRTRFHEWRHRGLIHEYIDDTVRSITPATKTVILEHRKENLSFDAIFVCAGAFESAGIILRSRHEIKEIHITDSSVYTFPVFHLRGPAKARNGKNDDRHVALTNGLVNFDPVDAPARKASLQLYAAFDYLWKYYVPVFAWPAFAWLGRLLRNHVLLGRLYLDESYSPRYALTLDSDDKIAIRCSKQATPLSKADTIWAVARKTLAGAGCMTLNKLVIGHKTSSHYLGGLPMGGDHVDRDGCWGEGLYLCDSLGFPTAPSSSPTFTIMANARRISSNWLSRQIIT